MPKKQYLIISAVIIAILSVAGFAIYFNQSTSDSQVFAGSTRTTQIQVSTSSSKSSSSSLDKSVTISSPTAQSISNSVTELPTIGNQNPVQISSSSSNIPASSPLAKTVSVESGYATYDQSKLSNAEYGRVVLFFAAKWCPSCNALDKDIKSNTGSIPEDLLILNVDYDTNPELRKKYDVLRQHTLVQVDKEGNLIRSSPGLYQLNTLDSVIDTFSK